MATTGYAHDRFARAARKVVVDIDEAELRKLNMPLEVAANVDAALFIEELLKLVETEPIAPRTDWARRTQEWKRRYPLAPPAATVGRDQISAYTFSRALSDAIPEGALIAPGSSGFSIEIFLLMLEIKTGQRCFHNRGTGAMGFAIPSALGACLAGGRRHTVSVDGDGGFQFNAQELATIAHLNLPIKFFVLNNGGYASIRASQNGYFNGNLVSADATSGLVLPELKDLAHAYRVGYERIAAGDDMQAKIASVLKTPGPVVCEVCVIPDEPREPRLSSSRRPDGSMVSRPLEDLFPFLDRDEFRDNMLIPVIEE
jgi:acetolactate synthase-1/2/3 large subunit